MGTEHWYRPFGESGEQITGQSGGGSPSFAATVYGPNRRFVQRVSVLAWTVAATVAISLFLRLPTVVFTLNALGSPMSIRISPKTTVIAGLHRAADGQRYGTGDSHPSTLLRGRNGRRA